MFPFCVSLHAGLSSIFFKETSRPRVKHRFLQASDRGAATKERRASTEVIGTGGGGQRISEAGKDYSRLRMIDRP